MIFAKFGYASSSQEAVISGNKPHDTSHTLLYAIELKPVSLENSYQTAAICFLGAGSCSEDSFFTKSGDDLSVGSEQKCIDEGYPHSGDCLLPAFYDAECPYDSDYHSQCITDNDRACQESGYLKNCPDGEVADTNQLCPYDSSYKKCKCDPCEGYAYTYAQATAQGYIADGSCNSCGEIKYKRKENPCSGYSACDCGGETGAKICYTGAAIKYDNCKSCCENKCTLDACPADHACDYEACSNKYCDNGCRSGYMDLCLTGDSCISMGYSPQSCVGETLYCPYNTSYRFCL